MIRKKTHKTSIFKRTVLLFGLTLAVLSLSACSKGGKEVSVDTAKLAKELSEQAVTSETLTQMAPEMVAASYYISDDIYASGSAWKGTGATACEVVVIEAKKAGQTKDVEAKLKEHVKSQSELYASYNAGEVEKLDNAVIKSIGKYTVLCVCDDNEKANDVLKGYGF